MTTPDLLIKKLENEDITIKEKLQVLMEFKGELEKYKTGELQDFKNTAIPHCLEYYYNFYSQILSNQSS